MGFGHVVAPEHHRVAFFQVVVVVGRFVHTERLIKTDDRGRHAEACVGIDVVGAEPRLHQFACAVGFGNGVLAGTRDRDAGGAFLFVHAPHLTRHFVQSHVPRDGREFAVLVVVPVRHAHQGLREAVFAVENLGVEVPFDAV